MKQYKIVKYPYVGGEVMKIQTTNDLAAALSRKNTETAIFVEGIVSEFLSTFGKIDAIKKICDAHLCNDCGRACDIEKIAEILKGDE
jgi:hypothetical protein